MKLPLILLALCLTATMAYAVASTQENTAKASLNAVNDRFNTAAAASNAQALIDLYAEDTLWIEQGKPVSQGLKGPRELFAFITANKGKVTHTIDHLFVADDESLAVMIGSVDAKVKSVNMDATGTYLFVLKPNDDGWKIITDIWHQHTQEE